MLETPHVLVGVAIASKIGNPLISFPLSFVSHLLLEKIPHWNPHLATETEKFGKPTKKSTIIAVADVSMAFIVGNVIALSFLPDTMQIINVYGCCFFSALPDIVEGPYFYLNYRPIWLKKWIDWQRSIQVDTSFAKGVISQLAIIICSLVWTFGA